MAKGGMFPGKGEAVVEEWQVEYEARIEMNQSIFNVRKQRDIVANCGKSSK
jgi:hypothetical protein